MSGMPDLNPPIPSFDDHLTREPKPGPEAIPVECDGEDKFGLPCLAELFIADDYPTKCEVCGGYICETCLDESLGYAVHKGLCFVKAQAEEISERLEELEAML